MEPCHRRPSGLAATIGGFTLLLITRLFVGIGEAGYGPAAPTLISDFYPVSRRGGVLAWFYMAIPVGSALGYILGGQIAHHFSWPTAFYAVVAPGLLLGIWSFFKREPRNQLAGGGDAPHKATLADYKVLLRTKSYVLDCAGMTAMTFAIGGISFWMPKVLSMKPGAPTSRGSIPFSGGLPWLPVCPRRSWAATRAISCEAGFQAPTSLFRALRCSLPAPAFCCCCERRFLYAWGVIFLTVFFLFFNTGPSNTILANVTHPSVALDGFALIFLRHSCPGRCDLSADPRENRAFQLGCRLYPGGGNYRRGGTLMALGMPIPGGRHRCRPHAASPPMHRADFQSFKRLE